MSRRRILTVLDHYRPATKGGGPAASVEDLVAHLGREFAFDILSSDRDLLDDEPFPGIEHGVWHTVGDARVRYLAPRERTLVGWARVLRTLEADVLYLNSLFARSSIRILLLRRVGLALPSRLVLAPRGELHPATLEIHARRKAAWLRISRALGLYEAVCWHAATPEEADHVRRAMGGRASSSCEIRIARHGPMRIPTRPVSAAEIRFKQSGHARIAFVSRISRKKHLDYAIQALVESGARVDFDIYGPIEDAAYWRECHAMLARLPPSVSASYRGFLAPEVVAPALSRYHLLLLPTRGESFGRVIVEAMVAGCPVLLSDQTPWTEAVRSAAGWAEDLSDRAAFASRIRELAEMNDAAFQRLSEGACALGRRIAAGEGSIEASRQLFVEAPGVTSGADVVFENGWQDGRPIDRCGESSRQ